MSASGEREEAKEEAEERTESRSEVRMVPYPDEKEESSRWKRSLAQGNQRANAWEKYLWV